MQEASGSTGLEYLDRGPRRKSTIDRAIDDGSDDLFSLARYDRAGIRCGKRLPTAPEAEAIRQLYRDKRRELEALGAELNLTDFYHAPHRRDVFDFDEDASDFRDAVADLDEYLEEAS